MENKRSRLNEGFSKDSIMDDPIKNKDDNGAQGGDEPGQDRLQNFFGGRMDERLKNALKRKLAENTLDSKDGVIPLNFNTRSCADILSAALLQPRSDDA